MSQLIPVGAFEILLFRMADDPSKYACQILCPPEFAENIESWVEAAACLGGFVARHSNLGYEKILEVITERTMAYRDNVPPDFPDTPNPTIPEDPGNPANNNPDF